MSDNNNQDAPLENNNNQPLNDNNNVEMTDNQQQNPIEEMAEEEDQDVVYMDQDEIDEMDAEANAEEDDFQTINESDIGDIDHQFADNQILSQQIIEDNSTVKFDEHRDSVFCVTVVPREPFNTFISGDCHDKAYVWKIISAPPPQESEDDAQEEKKNEEPQNEDIGDALRLRSVLVDELKGHTETVEFAKFSFDGKYLVTGGMNNKLRIWNGETFEMIYILEDGPTEDLNFLEWHPKGNVFITGGKDYLIWMYNGVNGQFLGCLSGHEEEVLKAAFTLNDGGKHIVSCSVDKTIRLWAPLKQQCLQVIKNTAISGVSPKFHDTHIGTFALHHERPLIVSGDMNGKVYYSHYQTGEIGGLIGEHSDSVESIAFSRSQPVCVSAGIDQNIHIYDLNTNDIKFKIAPCGEYGGFTKLLFSQVHQHVLFASSTLGDLMLIDVRDGKTIKAFKGHAAPINDFIEVKELEIIVTAGDDNQCMVFYMHPVHQQNQYENENNLSFDEYYQDQDLDENQNFEDEDEEYSKLINTHYFTLKKSCFTENYLVFSLNERMPQMTELYLDKEDDLLDYCKKVVFQRDMVAKHEKAPLIEIRKKDIQNSFDSENSDINIHDRNIEFDEYEYENEGYEIIERRQAIGGSENKRIALTVENNILTYNSKKQSIFSFSKDAYAEVSSSDEQSNSPSKSPRKKPSITPQVSKNTKKKSRGLMYKLKLDNQIMCQRKFSEFFELRNAFCKSFPGCFVPKLIKFEATNLEVNQAIQDKIEKFGVFVRYQSRVMAKFRMIIEKSLTNQIVLNQRMSKFFTQMSQLEEILASEEIDINSVFRMEQKSCDRFNDLNQDIQIIALNAVDDFVRDELSDSESFNECIKEVKKINTQRSEIKNKLDRQFEVLSIIDRKTQKYKVFKHDFELIEKEFRDIDMLYNIIIINLAYVEIDKYKLDRQIKYQKILKELAQYKILGNNEVSQNSSKKSLIIDAWVFQISAKLLWD